MSGSAAADPAARTPVGVLREHLTELWGHGRLELAADLYAPDVVDHMPFPGQRPGVAGMLEVVRAIHLGFPDLEFTLHGVHAVGPDRALDVWTFRGTHRGEALGVPPTGRSVEFRGMDLVRVAGGRIAEVWHVEELYQLHRQLVGPDGADS